MKTQKVAGLEFNCQNGPFDAFFNGKLAKLLLKKDGMARAINFLG